MLYKFFWGRAMTYNFIFNTFFLGGGGELGGGHPCPFMNSSLSTIEFV
jgi:hypothetical protein